MYNNIVQSIREIYNTQDFIQSIIIGKFKQYDLFCEQYLQKLSSIL